MKKARFCTFWVTFFLFRTLFLLAAVLQCLGNFFFLFVPLSSFASLLSDTSPVQCFFGRFVLQSTLLCGPVRLSSFQGDTHSFHRDFSIFPPPPALGGSSCRHEPGSDREWPKLIIFPYFWVDGTQAPPSGVSPAHHCFFLNPSDGGCQLTRIFGCPLHTLHLKNIHLRRLRSIGPLNADRFIRHLTRLCLAALSPFESPLPSSILFTFKSLSRKQSEPRD